MTTQERADFWRQQITAWLDSGLSGHAFCKSQALVYHQFAYWRKKLEQPLEQPVDSDSLPGFVRVAMPAPVGTEVGLTLTLPNGITLSGLHPGNIALLGAIMRQL
ncbi:IS66 family insertion sequence element accessory protein TnpA [Aeromonas sp. QDB04]|uniref:IS66 family insertion sequence element accessory protein TnpA n=1 Tax=Aeromonas sp. QDB04 TaxID=2990477 RepID=UPI0022E2EB52|nr:IS66 family insertion sequence element accessory protein TnpB [Aeromonas sp. QDB04]